MTYTQKRQSALLITILGIGLFLLTGGRPYWSNLRTRKISREPVQQMRFLIKDTLGGETFSLKIQRVSGVPSRFKAVITQSGKTTEKFVDDSVIEPMEEMLSHDLSSERVSSFGSPMFLSIEYPSKFLEYRLMTTHPRFREILRAFVFQFEPRFIGGPEKSS